MSKASASDRFLRVARTLHFYASHPVQRVMEVGIAAGDRFGIPWLMYNPLVFRHYHRMAKMNAPGVMGAFAEVFPQARSFVDVGSGSGGYASEAVRHGWHVAVCEHARAGRTLARRQGVDVRPFDLARDPPSDLVGPFDLAYSFEVAEHVPPPLGDALVEPSGSIGWNLGEGVGAGAAKLCVDGAPAP